jgi:hypothetical protein
MFEKIPVPQVDYQSAYSDIGKQVGGFISSIPEVLRTERNNKFEDEKKRKEWAYVEEKMKNEKEFKTTMGNLVLDAMGNNYNETEKQAVQKQLSTQDVKTTAASTAEFVSSRNYLDTLRQKYPEAVFPKPIYGQSLEHYQKMTALAMQGAESKVIAGMMGKQSMPVIPTAPETPANPNSFYTDQQVQSDMQNASVPQSIPAPQAPQSQSELVSQMAGQGIDVSGGQAKAAISTIPTDYQRMQDETRKTGLADKATRQKEIDTHKNDVLEETKRWHNLSAEISKQRNRIAAGAKDDTKALRVAKLIQDGEEAAAGIDSKIYTVEKGISGLEKEKRKIQQQITDAYGDASITQVLETQLNDLDSEISTYKNQKDEYRALQKDMKTDIKFWSNDVLKKTIKKKGFNYPGKEKPSSGSPQGPSSGVTSTGKKFSITRIQ